MGTIVLDWEAKVALFGKNLEIILDFQKIISIHKNKKKLFLFQICKK